MNKTATVQDVEEQLKKRLLDVLAESNLKPEGYDFRVRLHGRKRDKKSNASFENSWFPDTDTIRIEFQKITDKPQAGSQADLPDAATFQTDSTSQPRAAATNPLSDLIRALDQAESRPGYKFVALKWFRDTALPAEGFAWASDYSARDAALRDAIKRRLVLPGREPNPKNPLFPVTSIRLNRLVPEVRAILGTADDKMSGFEPLPIRGESLSQTVLSDRR